MTGPSECECSRRRALGALAVASTLPVAGCVGAYGPGTEYIDLRVYNESPDEVTVAVTFERDGEVAFEETYTLGATHVERRNSVLEAGPYEVTAESDAGTERLEYDFVDEACNKWVSVSFDGDGEMTLTSDHC